MLSEDLGLGESRYPMERATSNGRSHRIFLAIAINWSEVPRARPRRRSTANAAVRVSSGSRQHLDRARSLDSERAAPIVQRREL
jgi:hypothetical protein